ncbi:MAG: HlyD family secretion protein [Thermovirga sp.]
MAAQDKNPGEDPRLDADASDMPKENIGPGRRKTMWLGLVLLAATAAFWGIPRAYYSLTHVSTNDAFIDGTLVPVAAETAGRITALHVEEHQAIEAGTPLLEIDASDYSASVTQKEASLMKSRSEKEELAAQRTGAERELARTRAALSAAAAEAELANKDLARHRELLQEGIIPQAQFDLIESRARTAAAHLEEARQAIAQAQASLSGIGARDATLDYEAQEAEAELALARLDLSRTVLASPVRGIVAKKNAELGKYVQKGQTLFIIAKDSTLWVTANFKETQIGSMRIGQKVDVRVDAFPGFILKGQVESFQPGTGAVFSLLPPENATGNFVKVVQRLPVRIALDSPPDPDHPLRPGLSVTASVSVRP